MRFLLEILALGISGYWGWNQSEGYMKYLLAILIPVGMAILWGVFAVRDDPSRSGNAPVPIPGILRLLLELAFFGFSAWAWYDLGNVCLSIGFGIVVTIHYVISYDRIGWLLLKK